MKKKEYTKPGIVKVELNHEQAVLGTCSATSNATKDSDAAGTCYASGCKARKLTGGDSTSSS